MFDAVFSYGRLARIFQSAVPLMLLKSAFQRAACLLNVDSAAFTGNFVDTRRMVSSGLLIRVALVRNDV
jgi:hypothetical protein